MGTNGKLDYRNDTSANPVEDIYKCLVKSDSCSTPTEADFDLAGKNLVASGLKLKEGKTWKAVYAHDADSGYIFECLDGWTGATPKLQCTSNVTDWKPDDDDDADKYKCIFNTNGTVNTANTKKN